MSNHIVLLEAAYDNSDIMTDYFAKDTPYMSWYVCDYPRHDGSNPSVV